MRIKKLLGIGTADAHWHRVLHAGNYTVQVCSDPIVDANWARVGTPTKSSFTIEHQVIGTKIWARVCANGTAGAGPYSDPAFIVVS